MSRRGCSGNGSGAKVTTGSSTKALHELNRAAAVGGSKGLYDANREVYERLRYGVKVKPSVGERIVTAWLIDWKNPGNNHFAIAEEVTVAGRNTKRPDLVPYVNGIAIGVLELKRSTASVSEGIRQNLDSQKPDFIESFFATTQGVESELSGEHLVNASTQHRPGALPDGEVSSQIEQGALSHLLTDTLGAHEAKGEVRLVGAGAAGLGAADEHVGRGVRGSVWRNISPLFYGTTSAISTSNQSVTCQNRRISG